MKNSVAVLLWGVCILTLNSCMAGIPLVNAHADNNDSYRVQYLFEHEGTKIYRFYDMGNYVYFSNRSTGTMAISNDSIPKYVQVIGEENGDTDK